MSRASKGKSYKNPDMSGYDSQLAEIWSIGRNNGGTSSKKVANGGALSNQDIANQMYEQYKIQQQNQIDRDMVRDQYGLQVVGMQDAGLNPAMMFGGATAGGEGSSTGGSASGAPMGNSVSEANSGFENALGIMGQFVSMLTGAANFRNGLVDTQTKQTEAETHRIDVDSQAEVRSAQKKVLDEQAKNLELNNSIFAQRWTLEKSERLIGMLKTQGEIHYTQQQLEESKARVGQIRFSQHLDVLRYNNEVAAMLKDFEVKDKTIEQLNAQITKLGQETRSLKVEADIKELCKGYGLRDDDDGRGLAVLLGNMQASMPPDQFAQYYAEIYRRYKTGTEFGFNGTDSWQGFLGKALQFMVTDGKNKLDDLASTVSATTSETANAWGFGDSQ